MAANLTPPFRIRYGSLPTVLFRILTETQLQVNPDAGFTIPISNNNLPISSSELGYSILRFSLEAA